MVLIVSPPALASPMTFAPEPWAWSRKEEKSALLIGWRTPPKHLAAVLGDDGRGVALQRVAEGVVGGEEVPAVAAGRGQALPVPLASATVS
jgi:hypothetical protein